MKRTETSAGMLVCDRQTVPLDTTCEAMLYCGNRNLREAEENTGTMDPMQAEPNADSSRSPDSAAPLTPTGPDPTPNRPASSARWEVLIGGNWLNKLGVLLLLIGLALFIGYAFQHLGPAGRIAVGFGVSAALLLVGVLTERRERYAVFARGLIGGGWAGLYFTTYAMHAFVTPPLIADRIVAVHVLLGVSAGMILHSLRYRSEAVTGLTYFVSFATVAIGPMSTFTVIAVLPLTASLLYVAYRFEWFTMAVFGAIAAYGTYVLRFCFMESSALSAETPLVGQSVLAAYGVLFELFDIMRAAKRRQDLGPASAIAPINAVAFLGLSVWHWWPGNANTFFLLSAYCAGAYTVSAVARGIARLPSSFDASYNTLTRMIAGGYEGPVTIAVILAAVAAGLRFSGMPLSWVWIAEAEVVFLLGFGLGLTYLRQLAAVVFLLPLWKLVNFDLLAGGHIVITGHRFLAWTPFAFVTAALFYANRLLIGLRESAGLMPLEFGYGFAATALFSSAAWFEVPYAYHGPAFLLLAAPLLEAGLHKRFQEFRYQAYGVAVFGLATLGVTNVLRIGADGAIRPWISLGLPAGITFAAAFRMIGLPKAQIPVRERQGVLSVSSIAGTALTAVLMWHVLSSPIIALGWAGLSLGLVEAGFLFAEPVIRLEGHIVAVVAFGRLFLANFASTGQTLGVSHRLLTVVPIILLFYHLWERTSAEDQGEATSSRERKFARFHLYAPAILAMFVFRFELGRVLAVYGWAVFGLALLCVGVRWDNRDLRWQSYLLAVLTFARSWVTNFYIPESLSGAFGRVLTGAVVVAAFYASEFVCPRSPKADDCSAGGRLRRALTFFDRNARTLFSLLGTALLTVLLFYEVSGKVLTVSLGMEGTAILAMGFVARERVLRLSGLALLLFCIAKLLLYDVRELETLFRIVAFIALGLLLLVVSWLYARFEKRILGAA